MSARRDLTWLQRSGPDCIEWPFGKSKLGYGRLRWNGEATSASRVALEYKLGRPLQDKHEACHTCDNRLCINHNHLYEGTRSDNVRDAWARTRKFWKSPEG